MQLVYTHEAFPDKATKSIFLAGPSPHQSIATQWQDDAITELHEQGYDGCVFVPVSRDGVINPDYKAQSDWEQDAMDRSDVIVFWIPRNLETHPGFTTNVEFGQRVADGNVILGYPADAPNMRYLHYLAERNSVKTYHTLLETITAAREMISTRTKGRDEDKHIASANGTPKKLTDEELFCLGNTGAYKQYYTMRKRFENGECSFCHVDPVLNHILFENDDWFVVENAFKNGRACSVMLLLVTKTHTRKLTDITAAGWTAFHEVLAYIEQKFDVPGGMLFLRFGDMRFNAGSVPHLHINIWVPDQTNPLSITIFKDEEERGRHAKRAAEFAARYEDGEIPEMD